MSKSEMPTTARNIGILADLMAKAQKFLLPNCAEMVDPVHLNGAHLDLLRLPYPITIFEAPWENDEPNAFGAGERKSSRRITVCWELSDDFDPFSGLNALVKRAFPDGGTFIYPVFYDDGSKTWSAGIGGQFVPYDYSADNMSDAPASVIAHDTLRQSGRLNERGFRFRAEPFVVVNEGFDILVQENGANIYSAMSKVILDSNDEVTMTVQACAVLNCANVETLEIKPSSTANARRSASKKTPFFTYKVLQIAAHNRGLENLGGSNASPRTHLRRGHIRRLENKTTWVRASMVNPGSDKGRVEKDYKL